MTSRQDISRTNSVQQKAWNLIRTTHNGQKEWRVSSGYLIRKLCSQTRQMSQRHLTTARKQDILYANLLMTKFGSKSHVISSRNLIRATKKHQLSSGNPITAKKHDAPSQHIPSPSLLPNSLSCMPLHPHLATNLNHRPTPLEPLQHGFTSRPS